MVILTLGDFVIYIIKRYEYWWVSCNQAMTQVAGMTFPSTIAIIVSYKSYQ